MTTSSRTAALSRPCVFLGQTAGSTGGVRGGSIAEMLEREAIITALANALRGLHGVQAAAVGGSEATGRTDAFSDVDLMVYADDDAVEEVFAAAERALGALSPIELVFRMPQTPWPGLEQAFYRLRDAGPHLLVDLSVIRMSTPTSGRFLERERHGTPRVLFDDGGVLAPAPIDRESHNAKIAARLAELRIRFPLFQTLVTRAIERGQGVDAMHFYMGFTLRPLIDLLRIAHCPDRFDFGPRYLRYDLPAEAAAAVEELSFVPDLAALRDRQRRAEAIFEQTLRDLDRRAAASGG